MGSMCQKSHSSHFHPYPPPYITPPPKPPQTAPICHPIVFYPLPSATIRHHPTLPPPYPPPPPCNPRANPTTTHSSSIKPLDNALPQPYNPTIPQYRQHARKKKKQVCTNKRLLPAIKTGTTLPQERGKSRPFKIWPGEFK